MKLSHIFYLFVMVALASCTTDIDLQLDDPEPVLVIDGKLNQDSLNIIRLSEIQNYFASTLPDWNLHKNAAITLFEDSSQVAQYSFNDAKSRFEVTYPIQFDHFYHIEITLESGDKYLSQPEWVEEVSPIDSIWFEVEDSQFNDEEEGRDILILINTWEPEGQGDFYQWKAYINGEYLSEPFDLSFSDDRFVDGQFVNQFEVLSFTEKEYREYRDKSPTGQVIVTIEQHKITGTYYGFLTEVFNQTAIVGSPFSAPPAEIRGNVYQSNDPLKLALGYYAVSHYDAASVEVIIP